MGAFRVFSGNRLDLLAEELARTLSSPLPSPFDAEIVFVQNKGMQRWLTLQLVECLGVCANFNFPSQNALMDDIFRCVLPDFPEQTFFEPKFSTWAIMGLLPGLLAEPGFEELNDYLRGETGSLKHLQLSTRIAETFDHYTVYRPDFIEKWESGEESHWQAVLWREFAGRRGGKHRAALRKDFFEKMGGGFPAGDLLPRRISVFGISYLPPFYMEIFEALGKVAEVNLFLLNPCREYWGRISSSRDTRRIMTREASSGLLPADLHIEKGNSLLASMGTLGRDFFDTIAELRAEEVSCFEDPGEGSLLSCIQSDILNLRDRVEPVAGKKATAEDDRSIEIHSCHGPMREVEVLFDRILEMFERDRELLPKDILVMTPDVEAYAPYIQAIFDAPESPAGKIPYSIADRSMRRESAAAEAFLSILGLPDRRITAPEVLDILESPCVCRKFELSPSDFDRIAHWVRDVRIRWGVDERHRSGWGAPAFPENTWKAGLERLLLGYALPGKGENLFHAILPYDPIEGNDAAILGKFAEFADRLFGTVRSLDRPGTLSAWSESLLKLASDFFRPEADSAEELKGLRRAITDLGKMGEVSGFTEPVGLPLIRWHLTKQVEKEGFGFGFLAGGITFCSMLPMRSIPFKVICLIGMDGNGFPRQTKVPEFDLMAKNPRRGDRSTRNDDRCLFLEAIVSARDKLYISWTGQSCRDNAPIPPSVLVSELMDAISKGFIISPTTETPAFSGASGTVTRPAAVETTTSGDAYDRLVTRHRLQPFSPAYFKGDPKLTSYSRARLREAECVLGPKRELPPFVSGTISPPDEAMKNVTVGDLERFFANPARFFLNRRFGIYLGEDEAALEETESFELKGLPKYILEQELIESLSAGGAGGGRFDLMKASGRLPHGTPGESAFKNMQRGVEDFIERTGHYISGKRLNPLDIDLRLGEFHVTGRIHSIYEFRLVRRRYGSLRAKDRLDAWISHLFLNLCGPPEYPGRSTVIGRAGEKWKALEYSALERRESPEESLHRLLGHYWAGLAHPLRFFPEASLSYCRKVFRQGKTPVDALAEARAAWRGTGYGAAEGNDPYYDLCFRSGAPFDDEFRQVSEEVFLPLLDAEKSV